MSEKPNPAQSPTPHKRRIFITITLLFPVAFFVCLEIGLRVFNYGPDLSLFKRFTIRGQVYYRMNPEVKFRYFGTSHFTPSTSPQYFKVPKPHGVYRIFCLGGSTTAGFPYYFNGSFPFYLQDRLKAMAPQRNVEVINLGMTATNSFTTLDIAKELPAYEPDLILVYDGHNEFYGALGVASQQSVGALRFVTLSHLRLIHLRSFVLLRDMIQKILGVFVSSKDEVSRGTMMEALAHDRYVPSGSPSYTVAYESFRDNLVDLREFCRSAGIPLILGTQVSNLRHQAPFVSNHYPELTPQQRALFDQSYNDGRICQSSSNLDSAISYFQSAAVFDSSYADAHYRLAQCLENKGRKREALLEYTYARDKDELRFRMDSRFNDLVRTMDDHGNCFVADVEAAFMQLSPDSLVGHNLIADHLHPTAWGHFVLAKVYAQVMQHHGLFESPKEWSAADTLNEDRLWAQRKVTELDDQMAAQTLRILTSGWPFRNGVPTREIIPAYDTLGLIAQELATDQVDWMKAHELAVAFFQRRGDFREVEREYKAMVAMVPLDLELYMDLARTYLREKRYDNIAEIMQSSLLVYPTVQAYRTLGDVNLSQGYATAAVKYYEQAFDLSKTAEERLQNGYVLCLAYAKSGQTAKSEQRMKEILSTHPDFSAGRQLLNQLKEDSSRSSAKK